MAPPTRTPVTQFSAIATGSPGTPNAQPTGPGEWVLVPMPPGDWKPAYRDTRNDIATFEYIPSAESLDRWTGMVTIQVLYGSRLGADQAIAAMKNIAETAQ